MPKQHQASPALRPCPCPPSWGRGIVLLPTCPGARALVLDNLASPPFRAQVDKASIRHGGENVAAVLRAHGVRFLFTLVGGHISPLLVACEKLGIRVVDTRHEVTAVFAADAVARLTGEGRVERARGW